MAEGGEDQAEKARKLRELFFSKHNDDVEKGLYDQRDVDKFKENDKYVCSFIRSFETQQDALSHVHESLKFRKEIELNDLTDESFPMEVWESGTGFFHNHDKDGLHIYYIQVKKHKKDPQTLLIIKKCFSYMLEVHQQKYPDEKIVLLFDLAGAGLAQMDMDFIKFIIISFKVHFPGLLAYMLMFEMPWIFNAAWKVIKTMLHAESVKRIKFVTKSDIQQYINKDQLWEHMGGTDTYVYKYESDWWAGGDREAESDTLLKSKRVTFADQDGSMYKSLSNDSIKDADTPSKPTGGVLKRSSDASKRRRDNGDNSFMGRLLTVCPAEELEFVMEEGTKEASDTILLKNSLPYSIAYKVKTTSPEKYRVRPSSGLVKPGSEKEVIIHLQQAYQNTVHKDKFLVMAMEVANESNRSISDLWKSAQKDSIMEHRLRCVVTNAKDTGDSVMETGAGHKSPLLKDLSQKVDSLVECNARLQRTVGILLILQVLLVSVVVIFLVLYSVDWFSSEEVTHKQNTCPRS